MKRQLEQVLIKWKCQEERKPLLLEGARQVGKTWLLREFGKNHFGQFILLDFAEHPEYSKLFEKNLDVKRIISEIELKTDIEIDMNTTLIVFDEIQSCPNAITALKYFYESYPNAYICASGSLLGIGLGTGGFPVGKVQRETLYPMIFTEFLEALGEKRLLSALRNINVSIDDDTVSPTVHEKALDLYKQYLIVGGLPEVVKVYIDQRNNLSRAYKAVRDLQNTLIRSYMDDISKHSGKLKAVRISSLFKNIPEQLAKESSGRKFIFKGVLDSHSNYANIEGPLEWLNRAGLIQRVPICYKARLPLMSYTKENTFILYLFDVGILGAMLDIAPLTLYRYEFGQQKGYIAESFVIQEMRANHDGPIYSWAENTSEIEFLITHEDSVLPIEVKAGINKKAKSLKVFKEKYNPPASLLLTCRDNASTKMGSIHMPIYLSSEIYRLIPS